MKKILLVTTLVALTGFSFIARSTHTSAATTGDVELSIASGCVSYVDGQTGGTYMDVPFGADVNLTIVNNDGSTTIDITGSGVNTSVAPNTKSTNNQTPVSLSQVYRPVTLTFTPEAQGSNNGVFANYCPQGSSVTTSSITINPATASLACSLSGNQWTLSGSFSGNSLGTGIYSGSSLITSISPASISESLTAGSSAQAFSVIDGTDYSGKGTTLASTTCPAYAASSSASSSSKTNASGGNVSSPSSGSASANSSQTTTTSDSVKVSTITNNGSKVDPTKLISVKEGDPLVLSGKTVPFGVVTLIIHSTPKTVTTISDKDGNWSYSITGLVSGNHTVQASVKDPATGKSSTPSQLLAFTVEPATALAGPKSHKSYFVVAAALVVLLAGGGSWYLWHRKKTTTKTVNPPPAGPTIPTPPQESF